MAVVRLTLRPLERRVRGRPASLRGGGQCGSDAGHHFIANAGSSQGRHFFFKPAKHAGVAALESHHRAAFACMLNQQAVDARLQLGIVKTPLAHVDPQGIRRRLTQGRVGQCVKQHHSS
jgi:uncharacterized protein YwbE